MFRGSRVIVSRIRIIAVCLVVPFGLLVFGDSLTGKAQSFSFTAIDSADVTLIDEFDRCSSDEDDTCTWSDGVLYCIGETAGCDANDGWAGGILSFTNPPANWVGIRANFTECSQDSTSFEGCGYWGETGGQGRINAGNFYRSSPPQGIYCGGWDFSASGCPGQFNNTVFSPTATDDTIYTGIRIQGSDSGLGNYIFTATDWFYIVEDVGVPVDPDASSYGECYECTLPINFLSFGEWFQWFLCHFRNIYFCYLYVWLLNITNAAVGLWYQFISYFVWLAATAQEWINAAVLWVGEILEFVGQIWVLFKDEFTQWLVDYANAILRTDLAYAIYTFVTLPIVLAEVVGQITALIIDWVIGLFQSIVDLFQLVINLIVALRDAFEGAAYEIDFIDGSGDPSSLNLGGDGPTPDKLLWFILASAASFDTVIGGIGINYIITIVIGLLAAGLIYWTVKHWQSITPI